MPQRHAVPAQSAQGGLGDPAALPAILEAAARILETGGATGLNTNAIAQRAGVSVGSLYQYFPNKEAILAELIREKRGQLLDWMQQAEAGTRDAAPEQAFCGR